MLQYSIVSHDQLLCLPAMRKLAYGGAMSSNVGCSVSAISESMEKGSRKVQTQRR